MQRLGRFAVMVSLVSLFAGCGESAENASYFAGGSERTYSAKADTDGTSDFIAGTETLSAKMPLAAAETTDKTPTPRKIIYTANVDLVVEDFASVPDEVTALVAQYGGFVANSQFQGSAGSSRSGIWTLRVPIAQYESFLAAAQQLGEVRTQSTTSREVTDEFYDVEARIRNKQREEERLLEHLKTATGKLEEILAVEREISRVREEVERLQGRLRVLTDQTELTTVTLHVDEIKNYVPVQAVTFGSRINVTFSQSIAALVTFGQGLVLVLVGAGPWLVVMAIPAVLVYALIRRRIARRTSAGT